MATPIHLDVQTVARAALKAYEEGRLSAQGPTPACRYRDASGRPCAIGAAIPDDVAASWDSLNGGSGVYTLIGAGEATTDGAIALMRLQDVHDLWTTGGPVEQDFVALCRELAGADTTEQEQRP